MATEHASYSLFSNRPVTLLWVARVSTSIAYQMQVVAVGWQIYVMTSSPMQLGFVGLMQLIPQFALVLVAGHVVDQHDRKRIMLVAQGVEAVAVAVLAFATRIGPRDPGPDPGGRIRARGRRARSRQRRCRRCRPQSCRRPHCRGSIAELSSATQTATIAGPAIGGLMLILGTSYVYMVCALLFVGSTILIWCIPIKKIRTEARAVSLATVFAGINFVRHNPLVLGAMSLDMFAVIFAGATACCRSSPATSSMSGPGTGRSCALRQRWARSPARS